MVVAVAANVVPVLIGLIRLGGRVAVPRAVVVVIVLFVSIMPAIVMVVVVVVVVSRMVVVAVTSELGTKTCLAINATALFRYVHAYS